MSGAGSSTKLKLVDGLLVQTFVHSLKYQAYTLIQTGHANQKINADPEVQVVIWVMNLSTIHHISCALQP